MSRWPEISPLPATLDQKKPLSCPELPSLPPYSDGDANPSRPKIVVAHLAKLQVQRVPRNSPSPFADPHTAKAPHRRPDQTATYGGPTRLMLADVLSDATARASQSVPQVRQTHLHSAFAQRAESGSAATM